MTTIKDTPQEWDYIQRIKKIVQRDKAETIIPLGDDAFVTATPKLPLAMSQDMLVEGVHFSLEYCSAQDLGHKALAVNLSDFAAMGATPKWAQVSLALPANINKTWLDEFYQSMSSLADRYGVEIVGGDLCVSPKALVIDVSLCGEVAQPISRQGAEVGDWLLCSGPLGLSALGLQELQQNLSAHLFANSPEVSKNLSIQKHLRPEARLDLLPELQRFSTDIHALIDVSDGLVNECLHLTRKLALGVDLFREKILELVKNQMLAEANHKIYTESQLLSAALWGGEDYELLMAIPPHFLGHFVNLQNDPKKDTNSVSKSSWKVIGQFNEKKEIALLSTINSDGKSHNDREVLTKFKGWRHFGPVSK